MMSASPNAWLTFRSVRKFYGPPWLTSNGESLLLGYSLDVIKDAWIERLRQGLLARFPQINPQGATPATDALASIGRDRGLVQGVDETSEHYAVRLVNWLPTLKTKGNPFALLGQLAQYLPPGPQNGVLYRSNLIAAAKSVPGVIVRDDALAFPLGDVVPSSPVEMLRVLPTSVTFV